jgi:hypothetical protein
MVVLQYQQGHARERFKPFSLSLSHIGNQRPKSSPGMEAAKDREKVIDMRASRDNWHGTGWKSLFLTCGGHRAPISTSIHFRIDM